MSHEPMRPACFGSAVAFSGTASECASCPFNAECAPLAGARLALFQSELGIVIGKAPAVRPKRVAAVKPAAAAGAEELPTKVRDLYQRIIAKGVNVSAALRQGENPFAGKTPAFLDVTCRLLLRGGFDRQELRTCLMDTLNWTYGTANSHVGQIYHLVPALGAGVVKDGRMTAAPLQ